MKRRSQRDYTLGFKLSVVEEVEKGSCTYKNAQKKYGIQGRSTVLVWLRKHGTLDWTKPKLDTLSGSKEKTPEQRIKELEAALASEQMKTLFPNYSHRYCRKAVRYGDQKKVFTQTARKLQAERKVSLSQACRLFGISRQGFYQKEKRHHTRLKQLQQVKAMVMDHRRYMPRLGTRKAYHLIGPALENAQIKLGRDALFDFLRSEHMLIKPRKSYTKTTWSKHWLRKHPNLYKDIKATRSEQVWVSDITYINTRAESTYLSLVTDAYSRKIVGHYLSSDLRTEGVAKALKAAIQTRKTMLPLIHHSDRGLQYCSEEYQRLLASQSIQPSMTDGYDCYQNALAERINGILKDEFLLATCENKSQLEKIIDQSISIYNSKRPHLNLNYKTPTFIHEKSLAELSTRDLI